MPPGHYRSTCRLYGNLLNAGRFYFSVVGFSANWSDPFRVDQAVMFDAIDDGVLRGDYYSGFGGSLRPKFLWETAPASDALEPRSPALTSPPRQVSG